MHPAETGLPPESSHAQVGRAGGGLELAVEVPRNDQGVEFTVDCRHPQSPPRRRRRSDADEFSPASYSHEPGQVRKRVLQLMSTLQKASGMSFEVRVDDGDGRRRLLRYHTLVVVDHPPPIRKPEDGGKRPGPSDRIPHRHEYVPPPERGRYVMSRFAMMLAGLPETCWQIRPIILLGDAVVPDPRHRRHDVVAKCAILALLEAYDVRIGVR